MSDVKWDATIALELADRCERQHDAIHTPGHQAADMLRAAVAEIEYLSSSTALAMLEQDVAILNEDITILKDERDRLAAENATLREFAVIVEKGRETKEQLAVRACGILYDVTRVANERHSRHDG